MKNILISGYYGFRNSGDDALLLAIANDLRAVFPPSELSLTVLSASPEATEKEYGLRAVNRMNPFSLLFSILHCDLLLSGGGTLIQDRTSTKSLLYYLAVIRLATLFGKKVMLYSNGIGPLREKHRGLTRRALNRVSLITLRDPASRDELSLIGVNKPKILLTADPAFSLLPESTARARALLCGAGLEKEKKTFCLSVRPWALLPDNADRIFAESMDELCRRENAQCVLIPMQPEKDTALCESIRDKMTLPCAILPPCGIRDTLAVIGECSLCIGMRLHSLIYAVSRGVPVVGISYDPKIAGVMDYMGKKEYFDVKELSQKALCDTAFSLLERAEEFRADDEKRLAALREKARENAILAYRLLTDGKKDEGRRAQ